MSRQAIYYSDLTPCPDCGHPKGWHGADTQGCSQGSWCLCVVVFPDHPIKPDPEDETSCLVCRGDIDLVVVHGFKSEEDDIDLPLPRTQDPWGRAVDGGAVETWECEWDDHGRSPSGAHTTDQKLDHVLSNQRKTLERVDTLMGLGEDLLAAVNTEDAAIVDAANRVIATINDNNTALTTANAAIAADAVVITDLQAQIAAGSVTPAAAQAVLDAVTAHLTALAGIDTAPVVPIPAP